MDSVADKIVSEIGATDDWNQRVNLVRQIPERFGTAQHSSIYAEVARRVYVPRLAPDFAYVHWRPEYELAPIQDAYEAAVQLTDGFRIVDESSLATAILQKPITLRIFRLLLGLTTQEFAAATGIPALERGVASMTNSRVKDVEGDGTADSRAAGLCARVIARAMEGGLFPDSRVSGVRPKIDKPDTKEGWATVRRYADQGVPLPVFLHQRHYGGSYRQLLDATSAQRGDVLETALEELLQRGGVPFVRTAVGNQAQIARQFGITMRPAPDFVVYDASGIPRALIECKVANDGGTARDKAARYRSIRTEATRLGGIPVAALLAGLGWRRVADALGPVVRDTDGRVFTLATLDEIMLVQPFPALRKRRRTPTSRKR